MAERGVEVDHTTVHRRTVKILPILATVMRQRKRPVGQSWRMDGTYMKVGIRSAPTLLKQFGRASFSVAASQRLLNPKPRDSLEPARRMC